MAELAPIAFASAMPDVGPGGVWPAALLSGSVGGAMLAASAWVGIEASGVAPALAFGEWIAQHALWGAFSGIVATAVVVAGARFDASLASRGARRAAAARLALFGAALGLASFAMLARAPLEVLAIVLGAALAGFGGVALLARLWLHDVRALASLPRLDPLKVAAIVALLIVPLQDGAASASLREAWQVMLGR
jgi:hypothetical protein